MSGLRYAAAVAKRLFTPGEANSALAKVRPAAERMVAARARMRELVGEQGRHVTAIGGNGAGYAATDLNAVQGELERLAAEVADCVRDLDDLGVVVKDIDVGLLDFPAERRGEEVELCWQLGEETVSHWHPVGAGFRGRRPVDWGE